jgi:glycopeptide antibiotics resistance protein
MTYATQDNPEKEVGVNSERRRLVILLVLWIVFIIYGSLIPLHFRAIDFGSAWLRFREVPFLHLSIESRADWVANILLFIPLGFLVLGVFSVGRSGWSVILLAVPTSLLCTGFSFVIEFTQIWFPPRTVSQNDIYAETIGGIVGASVWIIAGQKIVEWMRIISSDSGKRTKLDMVWRFYILGFLFYSVLPLDITISVGELYKKYKLERIILIPFSYQYGSILRLLYDIIPDIISFIPIGIWIAGKTSGIKHKTHELLARVLLSGGVVIGVEFTQLFIYSRYFDTTDLFTGTFGIVIGHWIARRWRTPVAPQKSENLDGPKKLIQISVWSCLLIGYSIVLISVFWYPFDLIEDIALVKDRWRHFFKLPFSAMYYGTEFNAVIQVVRKTLFFMPIGVVCHILITQLSARSEVRACLFGLSLCYTFGLGMGIEVGKLLIASRYPDFTSVLLYMLGAGLGVWIANLYLRQE